MLQSPHSFRHVALAIHSNQSELLSRLQVMHMDLKELQSLHKRSKGTKRQKLDSPAPGQSLQGLTRDSIELHADAASNSHHEALPLFWGMDLLPIGMMAQKISDRCVAA